MKKKFIAVIFLILAVMACFAVWKSLQISDTVKGVANMDLDKETLDQLRKAGSNLKKPHELDFYLYFPSQIAANKAEAEIERAGFATVVRPAATGSEWLCLASKTIVPTIEEFSTIRIFFNGLTEKLGGEYDGWEAKVEN